MRPKALYLFASQPNWYNIYGPEEQRDIAELVEVLGPFQTPDSIREHPEWLREAEILFGGWGFPLLDREFLDRAPNLRAVFYGSGTVKGFVTDLMWERGIRLSGANLDFVIPVAEFTIAQIILCLKHAHQFAAASKAQRTFARHDGIEGPGCYRSTVGLVSLGMTARWVLQKLRVFDFNVIAYDPFVSDEEARELGVTMVDLETLFAESDVVSLHAPNLPETRGMITGALFSRMRQGASFINTARGAIVDEPGLIEVFSKRPDLFAVLDVTFPEPPPPDSALWDLPNVLVTPHIAGCLGRECRRGGRMVVEELRRYLQGEKLRGEITRERIPFIA